MESLARASQECTSQFSNFSPAHIPEAFSPSHNPSGESFDQMGLSAQVSETAAVALLRHEHMHTHLHYITSPTHKTN